MLDPKWGISYRISYPGPNLSPKIEFSNPGKNWLPFKNQTKYQNFSFFRSLIRSWFAPKNQMFDPKCAQLICFENLNKLLKLFFVGHRFWMSYQILIRLWLGLKLPNFRPKIGKIALTWKIRRTLKLGPIRSVIPNIASDF